MDTDYSLIERQAKELVRDIPYGTANLANISALIYSSLQDINWAGFYILDEKADTLILGPFQGLPACVRIPVGKGVCGTAAKEDRVLNVPDVEAFPGHIACDAASRSEIVVPFHAGDRVRGVLDIDSPVLSRFDKADSDGLERLVKILETCGIFD